MQSGHQGRSKAASKMAREEDARELIPLRLSNLSDEQQALARDLLAQFFSGALGDPDVLTEALPDPTQDDGRVLAVPQLQRAKRIAEVEDIKRNAAEDKDRLSALRLLIRIDGTQKPDMPASREQVWTLLERLVDYEWPQAQQPQTPPDEQTRRIWRRQLLTLRRLLLNAADDIAEFRAVANPTIGVMVRPHDHLADKIGRASRINLYAQEMAAVAMRQAALNPCATPGDKHAAINRAATVLAMNYGNAETAEWADNVLEATSTPEGAAQVLGEDVE